MSNPILDRPSNPRVDCVSSSKVPPCSDISENLKTNGYICNMATAGEALPKGAVLRPSTTVNRQVVQTTGGADIAVVGVSSETVSAGDQVCMIVGGEFQVLATGAVTRGNFLASSGTTGVAADTGAGGSTGDFAVATSTDAAAGTKLVWARFKKAEVF
jgi:hypothetical protein